MGWVGVRGTGLTHVARQCLIAWCALLVGELGVLAVIRDSQAMTTAGPSAYRGTPPELVAAGRELGIPSPSFDRLQVQWGLPAGLHEPRAGYITAAYYGGHVYLGPGSNPVDALAYEYLHDVWAHLAPAQRTRVAVLLDQFDADHHGELEPGLDGLIRADQSNGTSAGLARLDELHSIACSRTGDEHLRPDLRTYCNDVLAGRRLTTKKY
jgi:hypothetical protein